MRRANVALIRPPFGVAFFRLYASGAFRVRARGSGLGRGCSLFNRLYSAGTAEALGRAVSCWGATHRRSGPPLRPYTVQSHAGAPEIDYPAYGLSGGSGACKRVERTLALPQDIVMTLAMALLYQCEEGGGAGGRFLVPQHETAGLTPLFTAPGPSWTVIPNHP
jgi:hypothetical protein